MSRESRSECFLLVAAHWPMDAVEGYCPQGKRIDASEYGRYGAPLTLKNARENPRIPSLCKKRVYNAPCSAHWLQLTLACRSAMTTSKQRLELRPFFALAGHPCVRCCLELVSYCCFTSAGVSSCRSCRRSVGRSPSR